MIRRLILSTVLTACSAAVVFGARPATFVLKSGERISGELGYKGGNELTLNVGGQERNFSWNDVALIAFQPGDPAAAELQQLPQSDNPAELDRHAIVLRDGTVLHGKLYHISPDGESITYDPREGGQSARRDIAASQIARIYLSAPAARSVYHHVLSGAPTAAAPAAVATSGIAGGILVNANQPWTDTGITVKKGDRVTFNTSGQIRVTTDGSADAVAGPDGSGNFQGSRARYPVPAMPVGGLIGKVGNGAPFPIGANNQGILMPAAGRLYLGVNDDEFGDNSGAFTVTIVR